MFHLTRLLPTWGNPHTDSLITYATHLSGQDAPRFCRRLSSLTRHILKGPEAHGVPAGLLKFFDD